jgi:vacuolar protein-sorting-associated protein 4
MVSEEKMRSFCEELGEHIMCYHPGTKVDWSDIIGLENVKNALKDAVLHPIMYADKPGKRDVTGVLLFGPPGTGKSYLAQAISSNFGWSFINVRCSDLKSKWHGQTEKNIRLLFEFASIRKPAVLFFGK